MKAFKLFKLRNDGSLGPLFINRTQRISMNEWVEAEEHRTKGYAFRPGWHVTSLPIAPHLKMRPDRIWMEVEIRDFYEFKRPEKQGGLWFIAKYIKVVKYYDDV